MKKLIVLLLAALMLVGCQGGDKDGGGLSDTMRDEIRAYYKYTREDTEDTVAGKTYYGTYDGYVILMDAGMLCVSDRVEIGGRVFRWGSSELLLIAYKDGKEYDLDELYASGEITEEQLDSILAKHKEHFSKLHNWDHDDPNV